MEASAYIILLFSLFGGGVCEPRIRKSGNQEIRSSGKSSPPFLSLIGFPLTFLFSVLSVWGHLGGGSPRSQSIGFPRSPFKHSPRSQSISFPRSSLMVCVSTKLVKRVFPRSQSKDDDFSTMIVKGVVFARCWPKGGCGSRIVVCGGLVFVDYYWFSERV